MVESYLHCCTHFLVRRNSSWQVSLAVIRATFQPGCRLTGLFFRAHWPSWNIWHVWWEIKPWFYLHTLLSLYIVQYMESRTCLQEAPSSWSSWWSISPAPQTVPDGNRSGYLPGSPVQMSRCQLPLFCAFVFLSSSKNISLVPVRGIIFSLSFLGLCLSVNRLWGCKRKRKFSMIIATSIWIAYSMSWKYGYVLLIVIILIKVSLLVNRAFVMAFYLFTSNYGRHNDCVLVVTKLVTSGTQCPNSKRRCTLRWSCWSTGGRYVFTCFFCVSISLMFLIMIQLCIHYTYLSRCRRPTCETSVLNYVQSTQCIATILYLYST